MRFYLLFQFVERDEPSELVGWDVYPRADAAKQQDRSYQPFPGIEFDRLLVFQILVTNSVDGPVIAKGVVLEFAAPLPA